MQASFNKIQTASEQLMNNIKITYNSLFSDSTYVPTDEEIREMQATFEVIINNMQEVQNSLSPNKKYKSLKKDQVRDLLFTLALTTKTSALKAKNQIMEEAGRRK